ncbi:MAG: asparaginase [Sphingomonadales bacterium]|jgi:L-asparaginase
MARAIIAALALLAGAAGAQGLPGVRILATGGTIAGVGNAAGTDYKSGQVTVADLIAAVPGAARIASLSGEQIANVPSGDIDEAIWRRLHARVTAALADPAVAGVVITHGTDTLEETAFFLSLTVPAAKPVVVAGSMRPSTALSADGPENLLDAVRVATAPGSAARGVMVVMDDSIFDPASVTKVDVRHVGAFAAPGHGPIGHVLQLTPRYLAPPLPPRATLALGDAPLPKVAIAYAYAGFTADDVRRVAAGAQGLVIAGVGAGGFSRSARDAVRDLVRSGMTVVRTPRQGSGDIWPSDGGDDSDGPRTIAGRELTPAKARILLMLALQQTRDAAAIQALFDRFAAAP